MVTSPPPRERTTSCLFFKDSSLIQVLWWMKTGLPGSAWAKMATVANGNKISVPAHNIIKLHTKTVRSIDLKKHTPPLRTEPHTEAQMGLKILRKCGTILSQTSDSVVQWREEIHRWSNSRINLRATEQMRVLAQGTGKGKKEEFDQTCTNILRTIS